MLAELAPGTSIAGVFTKSATRSSPVLDCQAKLGGPTDPGAAILVNSGNANAFTGRHGEGTVKAVCDAVAAGLDLPNARIFTASTGVIGERGLSPSGIEEAAQAIMTTDTFAKGAFAEVTINGKTVKIVGIAKGSGMIAPDMATMLVYIFTDAKVEQNALQSILSKLNEHTFNCITVDSDTSTSDTLMLAATGASNVDCSQEVAFEEALHTVMLDLAHQVVKDGEGATKFVTISLTGAKDDLDAKKAALAIANSPLVKTAIAGEDPNWGRIVMAVGKSGAAADRDLLSIRFGDVQVASNGWVDPDYREEDGAALMKNQDIMITVDLGIGNGKANVWTCDLTHGYISINADYRS